jgi:DNA phosphorothioation-associated putative methyltransferase
VASAPKSKNTKNPPIVGKRVGGALYVHKDALGLLANEAVTVEKAKSCAPSVRWNVAKVEKSSVSLLLYEPFETDFPALLASTKVDLVSGVVTHADYSKRANPPILHRKELLLAPNDPRLPKFRALTSAAEDHDLFAEPNKIGTRAAWNAKIAAAGLTLCGGRLLRDDEEHHVVSRHKTAIIRRDLSQPMQLMMRLGVVTPQRSLFDYGCGQGEDVDALASQGFDAFGWDPHHATNGPRKPADIVNLGFVLNVIEDPRERAETLKVAWGFATQALCVAVMIQGHGRTTNQKPHGDGYLTSRGTFQRYYTQQDLREFVSRITGQETLSLAPGIVAVFKDKDLEQEVLLRRRSRILVVSALPRPPRRERIVVARPDLRERLAPMLDALRDLSLSLGRLPEQAEVPSELSSALADARIPWSQAREGLRDDLAGDDGFAASAQSRRDDLLVHFALMQFPGSPKYRHLPQSIQNDIRSFFGNHATVQDESRRLLFASGNREGIRADSEAAVVAGLAGMRGARHIRFRSSVLPRLRPRLRVLVGSAEVLQGGIDACDFVEINLEAPRIKMIMCDDVSKAIPFIVENIRVDLGRRKVSFDRSAPKSTPLYFKSLFLPPDDPDRERQARIDAGLKATGLFPEGAPEPSWDIVRARLVKTKDTVKADPCRSDAT